jgi:hypothetical protein
MQLLVATGMRPSNGALLRRSSLTWTPIRLLIQRFERKTGNKRNTLKTVWVCIVPSKAMEDCPLVHIAQHMWNTRNDSNSTTYLFDCGFERRVRQSDKSFATLITRRMTAVLEAVFVAVGVDGGMGNAKKLHIFRSICNSRLARAGATACMIESHVGWASTTRLQHYTNMKDAALSSIAPFLMAGRAHHKDPPHAAWSFFEQTESTSPWWARVATLAAAAGLFAHEDLHVDDAFACRVQNHMAKCDRDGLTTDDKVSVLKKRLRAKDDELRDLRSKLACVEKDGKVAVQAPTTKEKLLQILGPLRDKVKDANFPELCHKTLVNEITPIIDKMPATQRPTFGLEFSSPHGKFLQCVLLVGGAINIDREAFTRIMPNKGRSWTTFVTQHRNTHPVLRVLSTRTWVCFKESIGLLQTGDT